MYVKIRNVTTFNGNKENDLKICVTPSATVEEIQKIIFEKLHIEEYKQKLYYGGKQLVANHTIEDYSIRTNDVIQLLTNNNEPYNNENNNQIEETLIPTKSNYYKIGDLIDTIYIEHGGWFESRITNIFTKSHNLNAGEDQLIFLVEMDRNEKTAPIKVKFESIRPRSTYTYKRYELKPGMTVLVNYNVETPTKRGYWYDFQITHISNKKVIRGTLMRGNNFDYLHDCVLKFKNEIMRIEEPSLLTTRSQEKCISIPLRKLPLYCITCKDIKSKDCKECSCYVCGKKTDSEVLIICEECNNTYHIFCLNPPLPAIPSENEWYCPECKTDENEIIKPGEKLKKSPRKTWILKNHFGPVHGIEVGSCWQSKAEVLKSGIHGSDLEIHQSKYEGVYSIILNGQCEDVIDNGEEFYCTGGITTDAIISMNKALTLNCNAENNDGFGKADEWKFGKPIRVIRKHKSDKLLKYAPETGYRYDGIYKVIEYFPDISKTGERILRFLLRRDDPIPPPWIKQRDMEWNSECSNLSKKIKIQPYHIQSDVEKFIRLDTVNEKLWNECTEIAPKGKQKFMEKVHELFMCVCCCDVVQKPVTTICKHNVCQECLEKCLTSEIYDCPTCRFNLGENYSLIVNPNLDAALKLLSRELEFTCYNF